MNWFEHHIGDYDEATSHLTACEDGIYSRMLRKYYATEAPLIADLFKLQRLLRARSDEEKEAVVTILDEFFFLAADGWHQATCDEVIAAYRAGEPERVVKKANENNRMARHREERAQLFKKLTEAGKHAPWNIHIGELRTMVASLKNEAPATPEVPLPVTAPATPATATQPPTTNHQPPIPKEEDKGADPAVVPAATPATPASIPLALPVKGAGESGGSMGTAGERDDELVHVTPSRQVAICIALRSEGIGLVNPGNAKLLQLVTDGAEIDMFVHAARLVKDTEKATFPYILGMVAGQMHDAKAMAARARASPAASTEPPRQRAAREEIEQWAPRIAAQAPGAAAAPFTIDMEAPNGTFN